MRILFLARSLETGGAERQFGALAVGLKQRGHEVAIAVFYGGGALETGPRAAGVPVIPLEKRSRWDVVPFGRRALETIRRFDPDVLHGCLAAANLLAVAARPFLPRARVVWGVRASNVDWSRYDRFHEATFAASRVAARFADLVIVNSEAGARYHREAGFPADLLRVVPNGIDVALFRPDRNRGAPARGRWGFDPSHRVYGIVARLDPMKDHLTFLDAAARVAASDRSARFVAVGGGPEPYAAELRATPAARRLEGLMVWAGPTDDPVEAYNALDAHVLSSTGEGFPNAVAEAMACGVPCAVTDVGDAAAIVGSTGIVVPPGDAEALAGAMIRVVAPPFGPPPSAAARARIVATYSLDALCEATEALLRPLAEEARAGAARA